MQALLLLACVFREPVPAADSSDTAVDTDGGGDVGQDEASEPGLAVVLTANETLTVGALATVSLEDGSRKDGLLETSGDATLADLGGALLVLDRFDGARARVLDPADFGAEPREIAVDGGPYAAAACGGALYISRHQAGSVVALDPGTGEILAEIAVPGDPAGMAVIGGTLYVALHALDASGTTPLDGAVAAVDCASDTLIETWDAPGPLPAIQPWPGDPDTLLVRYGAFDRRGGVAALDTASGAFTSFLLESELDRGIADIALTEARGVMLTYDADGVSAIWCLEHAGGAVTMSEAERPRARLVDVALSPGGRAWIAARPEPDDLDPRSGLIVYNPDTCASLTGPDWFQTDEPPWRILIAPEW